VVPLFLGEEAGNGGETPVLVRFVELSRRNASFLERTPLLLEPFLVSNRQVNVGGVMVGRTAVKVSVFKGGVAGLHSLLREWDVAARDGVQIGLGVFADLRLHDGLPWEVGEPFYHGEGSHETRNSNSISLCDETQGRTYISGASSVVDRNYNLLVDVFIVPLWVEMNIHRRRSLFAALHDQLLADR